MLECFALLLSMSGCNIGQSTAVTLNEFRAEQRLSTLRQDQKMEVLAREHAEDMARRDTMDHAGFYEKRAPAGARAENVMFGCKDAACAMKVWINSSGHRANMVLTNIKSYGLASATSKSGKQYWALELGKN